MPRLLASPKWLSFGRLGIRRAVLLLSIALGLVLTSVYLTTPRMVEQWPTRKFDDEIKTKLRNQSIGNTLVIVPVNAGMLEWAENLLCSLKRTSFDVDNLLFWAMDPSARDQLEQKGRATYHDPSLFSVSTNENLNGDTESYKRMMRERPKFYLDMLHLGFDILMIDADTIFFQSPLLLMDDGTEIVFSTDAREFYQTLDAFHDKFRRGDKIPPICNGIFWMKSTDATMKLWQDMLDVFEGGWRTAFWRMTSFLDDQRGMDVLLNDGRARLVEPLPSGISEEMLRGRYSISSELNVRLLDQTSVVNGHLLKNRRSQYEHNLMTLQQEGGDRIAVHLNWNTKELRKEDGAKEMKLWLLDENGKCQP